MVADSMRATLGAATTAASRTASAVHVAASATTMGVFNVPTTSSYPNDEDEPWPNRHRDKREDAEDQRKSGPQLPYTVFREWSSKYPSTPRYRRKWQRVLRTACKPTLAKCATVIVTCFVLLLGLIGYVLLEPSKREAAGQKNQPPTISNVNADMEDTTEGMWLTERLPEAKNTSHSNITQVTTAIAEETTDSVTTEESRSSMTYEGSDDTANQERTTKSPRPQQQQFLDTSNITTAVIANSSAAAIVASSAITTATAINVTKAADFAPTEESVNATAYDGSAERLDSNRENAASNASAVS